MKRAPKKDNFLRRIFSSSNNKIRNLFREKIHVSWLICALSIGFLLGVGASILFSSTIFDEIFWLIFAGVLFFIAAISRLKIMFFAALLAGILLGFWRGSIARVDLAEYREFFGQEIILRGVISEDPDFGESGDQRLKISQPEIILQKDYENLREEFLNSENLRDYFTPLQGKIWLNIFSDQTIKRSDVVQISGELKTGFGTFPATMSYANLEKISRTDGADPMRDIRDLFGEKLRAVIPAPESDLAMGILAGQKTALPAVLSSAFLAASLTHIVVASGYNLTILVRFARRIFAKISRLMALILAGGAVICFALITGFSPSMTRAAAVSLLSLVAWFFGRKFHPLFLLIFVAALTILFDPSQIWGDAGWYMSFLSFAGVLILAPLIRDFFWGKETKMRVKFSQKFAYFFKTKILKKSAPKPRKSATNSTFREIILETFSAQIMAAPVIALLLGNFSPYGLIANLLVLPILPFTMLLSFIAGVGAIFLPNFLAQILACPAIFLLKYIILVANFVADFPGAIQSAPISVNVFIVIMTTILVFVLILKKITRHNFREDNLVK